MREAVSAPYFPQRATLGWKAEVVWSWRTPEVSTWQSAAAGDLAAKSHWLSQERVVAVAQREEPNSYWLLCGPVAGSREAWQRVAPLLVEAAPR